MEPKSELKETRNTNVKVEVTVFPLSGGIFTGRVNAAKETPIGIV